MIVDVNVILRAYFQDEAQEQAQSLVRDHVAGLITLQAPDLFLYELCNAVWQAERRRRISDKIADQIVDTVQGLNIQLIVLDWGQMIPLARRFDRSAYDASYLALAESMGEEFMTGDKRLFNAVHDSLEWVKWIEDYPSPQAQEKQLPLP